MEKKLERIIINNQKINLSKAHLENLKNFKDSFYSSLSHEIRNPINAILGVVDFLRQENLESIQAKTVSIIYNASLDLNHLLTNLLEINKIDQKFNTENKIKFNFYNELKKLDTILNSLIGEKEIEFSINIHKLLDHYYIADLSKINAILINILHNAVRFTNYGRITLNASLEDMKPGNIHLVKIEVIDTGNGIENEILDSIFKEKNLIQPLYGTANSEGTSLGLVIVKNFIDLLGGKLHINSIHKKGTTISFTLELNTILEDTKIKGLQLNYLYGKSLLIIDDSKIIRILLVRTLTEIGAKCYEAENGKEGLDILLEYKNDIELIITDFSMPILNGIEFSDIVKNEFKISTPIWLLSATDEISDKDINKFNFDQILYKPIDSEYLKSKVLDYFTFEKK